MRQGRNWIQLGVVLALFASLSCYPSGPSDVTDRDTVMTAFDPAMDFGAVRTWAMPDEVFVTEGSDDSVTDEFDRLILDRVAENMAKLGYVREMHPEVNGADAVVIVQKSKRTSTGWVPGVPPGWCGWPGWGFPGWGCYPPFYPWIPVSVTTGSVFVEMYDPNNPTKRSEAELPAVWGAVLNGLASGSTTTAARIREGIDQAFAQSPYLGRR